MPAPKQEYVQVIYPRYRGDRRPEKLRILDEFCQVTGHHRKHAIRLLDSPAPGAGRPPRQRDVLSSAAAIDALRAIWEAAGYPWSLRLKAQGGQGQREGGRIAFAALDARPVFSPSRSGVVP